ncbi:hypothetical protein ACET65_19850 [Aeromonas rivipollensis]
MNDTSLHDQGAARRPETQIQHEFDTECAQLFEALLNESSSKAFITNQILIAFCFAADQGLTPPPELVKFIAGGVGRVLQGSKSPWPTKNEGSASDAEAALVQYVNERYPNSQPDIAAALGLSTRAVGRRVSERNDLVALFLGAFRQTLAGADRNKLLDMLERQRGCDGKVPRPSMAGMSELEYFAHGLIEEIRRRGG